MQKLTFQAFLRKIVKLYFDKHVKLPKEEFHAQSQQFELSEHIDIPALVFMQIIIDLIRYDVFNVLA